MFAPATLNFPKGNEMILPQLRECSRYNPTRTALDWAAAGAQLHIPVSGVFQAPRTGLVKQQVMCQLAEKFDEKEADIYRE